MNFLAVAVLLAASASAATGISRLTFLAALPANATATCIKLDAAGNIYVGGYTTRQSSPLPYPIGDGFVIAFSADGATQVYSRSLSGTYGSMVNALAVGADGAVPTCLPPRPSRLASWFRYSATV
jgi:hypothetical protein